MDFHWHIQNFFASLKHIFQKAIATKNRNGLYEKWIN